MTCGGKDLLFYHKTYTFLALKGCLIKGETMHFEYICEAVTQGIMRVNLETRVPVLFGVLTVLTAEQALVRAGLVEGKEDKNEGVCIASNSKTFAVLASN